MNKLKLRLCHFDGNIHARLFFFQAKKCLQITTSDHLHVLRIKNLDEVGYIDRLPFFIVVSIC